MSVHLEAGENECVWEGTFKSNKFPNFVKGRIHVIVKDPSTTENYETQGYITFTGCVKHSCVYQVCVHMQPGSDPLNFGKATAECGILGLELKLKEYNSKNDVKGTYKTTTRPFDEGTVWMHITDKKSLDFEPKESAFTIFGF